jgi:hypothetical protein
VQFFSFDVGELHFWVRTSAGVSFVGETSVGCDWAKLNQLERQHSAATPSDFGKFQDSRQMRNTALRRPFGGDGCIAGVNLIKTVLRIQCRSNRLRWTSSSIEFRCETPIFGDRLVGYWAADKDVRSGLIFRWILVFWTIGNHSLQVSM